MKKRPFTLTLSEEERFILCVALHAWEDRMRDVRIRVTKAGQAKQESEARRDVARVNNLRRRAGRLIQQRKPAALIGEASR